MSRHYEKRFFFQFSFTKNNLTTHDIEQPSEKESQITKKFSDDFLNDSFNLAISDTIWDFFNRISLIVGRISRTT